ncbi:trinucleotide repeat-containing gene 18 protein-like isoform X5 [Branchiostoma lanceolatum]|uniref:trinucleotide repeat-containing gene 18 protein-like isoform X5 n=1 Tax=Branchiostoma lanceolatum TaxID=7740 RepID=UPI0034516245
MDGRQEFSLDGRHSHPHLPALTPRVPGAGFSEAPPPHVPGPPGGLGPRQAASADLARVGTPAGGHPGQGGHPGGLHPHFGHGHGKYGYPHSVQSLGSAGSSYPFLAGYLSGGAPPQHQPPAEAYKPGVPMQYPWPHPSTMEAGFSRLSAGGMYPGHFHPSMAPLPPHDQSGPLFSQYLHSGPASSQPQSSVLARLYEAGKGLMNGSHGSPGFGGLHLHATSRHSAASASVSQAPDQKDVSRSMKSSQPKDSERSSRDHSSKERERTVKSEDNKTSSDSNHAKHGDTSSKHDSKPTTTNMSESSKKETSSSSEKTSSGHSSAKNEGDSAVKLAATEKKCTIPMSVLDKKKAHARSPDLHSKEPPKPTPTDTSKLAQTERGSSGEVGVAATGNSATTTAAPVHTVAPTHKSQSSQHGNGKSVTTVTTTSSSFQPRMTYYSHSIQAQPEKETRKSLVCAQTYIPPLENGEQPNTFLARKLKSSVHQDKSRSNSPVNKESDAGGSDKAGSGTDSSNSRTEVPALPVGDARGPSELNGHAASRASEARAAPNGERTKAASEPSSRRHTPNSDRKSEESSKSSSSSEQSAGRTSGNAPSQDRRDKDTGQAAAGPQKDMIRIHDYPYRDIIHEYGQPRSAVTLHDAPATVYSHSEAPEMRHLSQMSGLHPEGARMHPEWRMPGSCASAASHMAALAAQHGYLTPDHPKFLEFYPNKDRSFLERSWPPTPFSQDPNHDRHRSSEPGKPDTKPASGSSSQPATREHSPRESTQEKARHQDRPSPQHLDVAKAGKTSKSTTPSPVPSSKSETVEENASRGDNRKAEKQQTSNKAEKVPAVGESSPYSASVVGKGTEGRRPPVGIAVAQQRAGTEGAAPEAGAPAGTGQPASNSAAATDRGTRASRPENADSSSDESEIPTRPQGDRCQSAPSAHHDKDREQFLREQRELAAEMAVRAKPQGSREVMNDLSGNLVVTGGASLPSNSPWASSLASHPHVPPHMVTRGSPAPAVWFSHYPAYPGIPSHPPPPGVGLEPGALPLAPHGGWQLARDPVTGGLVLVPPGTPLANPEMLERQQQMVWSSGSAPGPPSHLQHAHHLQLMSQQHQQHQQHMELLRQQELRHAEQYQIALHQHHAQQEEQKRWEAEEKRKQDHEKQQQQQQAEKCGAPRTWAHEDPALEKAGRAAMEAYLQAGIPVAGQPPYGPFPYPHPPYQYIYDQPALMRLVSSSAGSNTVTTTESSRDKERAAVTTTTSVHTSVSPSVSVSSQSGKQREEVDVKKSTEPSKEEPLSASKSAKDTEKSVAKQAIETSTQTTPEPERMQPIDQALASSKAPPTDFQPIKTESVTPQHGTEAESTQAIVPSSTEERPRSPAQATICSQTQVTSVKQSTESVASSVAAANVEKPVVKTEVPAAPQQQTQLREMSVQAETMVTSISVTTTAVTMSKSMVTTSLQNVDPELLQATEGMALLSRLAEEKSRSESGVAAVQVKVERQSVSMASVCTSMAAAAAAMTTDMSHHEDTGPEDSLVHSWGRWKWRSNLKLPQKEEQGPGSAFKLFPVTVFQLQPGPEGMDLVELDMRMKLAELQRRYKEKQRELARLQRKREKKRKKENGPVKRGPGRPRKRRFHQNSPKSSMKSGEGPSKVERRSKSPKGALHLLVEEMESEEPPKKKKKVTKDSAQQPAAPTSKPKGKKGKGKEPAATDEQEVKLEPPKSKKSKKSDNQPTKKGAKASSAVSSGTNKKSAKDDSTVTKHKPKASTSSDTTSEESGGKSKGKSGSSNKNTGSEEKTQTQKGKGKKKDKDSQASATSTTKGTGQGSKKSKDKTTTSNTPSRKRSFSLTQSLPQSDDSDDDLVNEDVFWSSLSHPKALSSKTSPKTTKKSKDSSKPKKKQKTEDSKVKVPKVKKTVAPKTKPKKVEEGSDSDSDEDDFSRRSHSEDDWSDADLDIDTMTYSETSGLGLLAKYAASSAASMPITPTTSKKRKKPSNNDDADDEAPASEVKGSKKRKPTQPSKKTPTSTSDTPAPKKPKKSKNTSAEGKVSRPKKKKVKEPEPVEAEVPLLDDDAWARRRSERIFLHEPPTSSGATTLTTPTSPTKGPSTTVTPFNKITSVPAAKETTPSSKASPVPSGKTATTPSGKVKKAKTEKSEETSTKPSSSKKTKDSTKETPSEPLVHPGDTPVSKPKKKTSKASKAAKEDATQTKKASKPKAPKKTPSTSTPAEVLPSTAPPKVPKVKASTPVMTPPPPPPPVAPVPAPALPTPTPMEQDSVSNESYSDGENLPLSNYVDQQRPSTPEPRQVNIQKEDLRDGLRVIIPVDGLFHTGYVDEIQPPDVYGVVIDGQRGHRPQVYSQEQILQEALHDVKPASVRFLPEGARVSAYWSQQYRCLYPGTVARMSPSPDGSDDERTFVSVEFDDGDSGRIPLDHVRLLPPNYPVVGKERGDFSMNPIMLHGKRRRRSGDVSKDGLSDTKGDTSDTDSSTVLMDQKEMDNVAPLPEKTKTPAKKTSTAQSRAKKGKAKAEPVLPLLDYDSYTGDLGVISEEEEEDGRSSSRKSSPKNSPKASPARSSSAGSTSKKSKKSNSGEKASKPKSKDSRKEPKVKLDSDEKPSPIPKSKANSEKVSKQSTASEDQKPTKSSKKEKKVSSEASDESASTKGEKKKAAGEATTTKKTKKARKAEAEAASSDVPPAKKTTKKDAAKQAKKDSGAQETQKSQKGKASDATTKAKAASAKVAPPDFEQESNVDDSEAQSFADSNSIAPSNVTSDVEDDDDISEDTRSERSEDIKKPTKKPPARGSKTRRRSADKTPSVESRSKIALYCSASSRAAFLPARQLWRWSGKSTQRRGVKGKGKKVFYKAIQRGHEIIRVGDSAVFMSTGRPNLPYVGRIENLWESWGGNMVVKVKWFYHPEETMVGRRACDGKMALYQSSHVDENDVQTISHRCEVVSPDEYERKAKSKRNQDDLDDLYYCAGTYDPTNGALQNVSGPL